MLEKMAVFRNKTVLVTGGTGSFGHFIAKKLVPFKPDEIRIFSRDEKKQDDMRYEFPDQDNITFMIGDVRNKDSLKSALHDVDIVYHAAALKQVPSCEYNVYEAIQTNAIGAQNIVEASIEEGVKKVIAISTDKAVKPVNTMGMTKALQERIFVSANFRKDNKKTIFACVRYGNVIGSRGSVIPLFKKQIENGDDVTITDPKMTRFVLTLSQAIELVFKATEQAVGGEIFVTKIPSVTIQQIADVMVKNLSRNKKTKIKIVGIRPGEKIHEVLVSEEEAYRTIERKDIFIILPMIKLPNVLKKYKNIKRTKLIEFTSRNTKKLTNRTLEKILKEERWLT